MTVAQLLTILRARWRALISVLVSVVALAALATALLPRQYTATAAVMLDVKSPDPIAGMVLPGMTTSGYMATQVEVASSERVALRAIELLKLAGDEELRAKWQDETEGRTEFESWLAELLLKKFDAQPSKDSNVITITYKSPEPEAASRIANAFMQAYIDVSVALRADPARQYSSMFDDRAAQLRVLLEKAQTKLTDFQREHGVIASDEKLDVENARLNELSSQVVSLQAELTQASSRQRESRANGDAMDEVLASPVLRDLKAELARQEGLLEQLSNRLGDRNPQVQEAKASIAQLRQRIASETRRVTSSLAVNESVSKSRLADVKAQLEAQRAKVIRLRSERDQGLLLQRDVQNAQTAYDAVYQRVSQTSMESQSTQTNVSVLRRAAVPVKPSSPKVVLMLAASVVLGTLLGIVWAVVRELRDPRLRSHEDVLLQLHQPLLGKLPRYTGLPPGGAASRGLSLLALRSPVRLPAQGA